MARTKKPAVRGRITKLISPEHEALLAQIRRMERIRAMEQARINERFHNGSTEDRLSDLPEHLIVHILSLLEMEDAVKTGFLSKRWINLWTQVDNLVYVRPLNKGDKKHLQLSDRRIHTGPHGYRWMSFIDSTLMKCTSNIKSFSLGGLIRFHGSIVISNIWTEYLDKWIAYLVDKKVENIRLENFNWTSEFLFQSSTITKLELFDMRVKTPTTVQLSALKSLLLVRADMNDADIGNILSGSPVLENLVLRGCISIRSLNIMSPSVKVLELQVLYEEDGEDEVFNLKAPWLQELKISGHFTFSSCELVDVSSLLKATLTFHTYYHAIDDETEETELIEYVNEYYNSWIHMVNKLLKSLSYVGELIIGTELIQVLLPSIFTGMPTLSTPLFMCKHLTVEKHIWKFDLTGVACLLENTPHLESLLMKVVPFPEDKYVGYETDNFFQDEDLHLNKPTGKFLKLKTVKVEYCPLACHENIKDNLGVHFEFELAEYILKRAVVLERLAFCSPTGWNCSGSSCLVPKCSFQYVSSLCSKLILSIMCLTGNKASGWELKRSDNVSEFVFSNYASLLSMEGSSQ